MINAANKSVTISKPIVAAKSSFTQAMDAAEGDNDDAVTYYAGECALCLDEVFTVIFFSIYTPHAQTD